MNEKNVSIELSPRAAAFLEAIVAAHEAHRQQQIQAHEATKAELLQAIQESHQVHQPHHLMSRSHVVPEKSREQIVAEALDRGLSVMLNDITQPPHKIGCYAPRDF